MLNLFNNLLGVRYNGEYSLLRSAPVRSRDRLTVRARGAAS